MAWRLAQSKCEVEVEGINQGAGRKKTGRRQEYGGKILEHWKLEIRMAGVLGVITCLRNPLELRFVIHQNPGLIAFDYPEFRGVRYSVMMTLRGSWNYPKWKNWIA